MTRSGSGAALNSYLEELIHKFHRLEDVHVDVSVRVNKNGDVNLILNIRSDSAAYVSANIYVNASV